MDMLVGILMRNLEGRMLLELSGEGIMCQINGLGDGKRGR